MKPSQLNRQNESQATLDKAELKKRLEEAGLTYQPIPGDGHCLYNAVGLYLAKEPPSLRNIVAAHLEFNPQTFEGFIETEGGSVADYAEAVRSGEEWATHVEIEVLMRVLDRPILIVGPDARITNLDEKRFSGSPILVYYNGIDHYDGLVLKQDIKIQKVLENLLSAAKAPPPTKKNTEIFEISKNNEITETIKKTKEDAKAIQDIKKYFEAALNIQLKTTEQDLVVTIQSLLVKHLLSDTSDKSIFNLEQIFKHAVTCVTINACMAYWDKKKNYPIFYSQTNDHIEAICYVDQKFNFQQDSVRSALLEFIDNMKEIIQQYFDLLKPTFALCKQRNYAYNQCEGILEDFLKEFNIQNQDIRDFCTIFLKSKRAEKLTDIKSFLLAVQEKLLENCNIPVNTNPQNQALSNEQKQVPSNELKRQVRLSAIEFLNRIAEDDVIQNCNDQVSKFQDKIEKLTEGNNLIAVQRKIEFNKIANTDYLERLKDIVKEKLFVEKDKLLEKLVKLIEGGTTSKSSKSRFRIFSIASIASIASTKLKDEHLQKIIENTYKLVMHQMDLEQYRRAINNMSENYGSLRPDIFYEIINAIDTTPAHETILPKTSLELALFQDNKNGKSRYDEKPETDAMLADDDHVSLAP